MKHKKSALQKLLETNWISCYPKDSKKHYKSKKTFLSCQPPTREHKMNRPQKYKQSIFDQVDPLNDHKRLEPFYHLYFQQILNHWYCPFVITRPRRFRPPPAAFSEMMVLFLKCGPFHSIEEIFKFQRHNIIFEDFVAARIEEMHAIPIEYIPFEKKDLYIQKREEYLKALEIETIREWTIYDFGIN
jgi:hypothetical protein